MRGTTSVIIPTRSRPDDLRRALESVGQQTALDAVREIVVIENGGTRDSESVCAVFPQLPIRYVHNDPPLPMSRWAERVFGVPDPHSAYLALLCDDDWWYPGHLAAAFDRLEHRPHISATWARVVETHAPSCTASVRGATLWLVTGAAGDETDIEVNAEKMLTANLLTTAIHISGFVGRSPAIRAVLPQLCNGNPFDIDRYLAALMIMQGPAMFLMEPTVGVRQHQKQESRTLGRTAEAKHWWRRTTREIVGLAAERGVDLAARLDELAERHPAGFATLLRNAYFDGLVDVGALMPLSAAVRTSHRNHVTACWLQRLLPRPVLRLLRANRWVEQWSGQPLLA